MDNARLMRMEREVADGEKVTLPFKADSENHENKTSLVIECLDIHNVRNARDSKRAH